MNCIVFCRKFVEERKCFFRKEVIVILSVVGLAVPPASAQSVSAYKQVSVHVRQMAAEAIRNEANQQRWQRYQAKLNLFIPAEASQLPPCVTPLKATLSGSERPDLRRLRYDVRCESGKGWAVPVTVKPDIYMPVLVAKNTLERGHIVGPADVTQKKFNITQVRSGYLTHPDDITGLTLKRRVREMQVLTPNLFDSPVLVERGQRVTMIAEQDGVEARTIGIAIKKGRKGEMIKIKNENSEREVNAIVIGMGMVRTTQAASREKTGG